jgi:hypothetical protein
MADPRLEFDIVADDKQARANLQKLETAGTTTTANIAKGFVIAQAAIAAVSGAVRAVTGFVRESIAASNEQIAAVTNLNAALEAHGNLTEETSQNMQDFAAEMQAVTTIGDETTLAMAAQIEAMTGLSGEALPDATQAAIQLSKAFGIDLVASAKLVGKELISDTSLLNRYGIQVDKTASQQDQLNQILQATASGMVIAKEEAKTYEGRMIQLENVIGDAKESIGALITENEFLGGVLGLLADFVTDLIGDIETWTFANQDLVENGIKLAVRALTRLAQIVVTIGLGIAELVGFIDQVVVSFQLLEALANRDAEAVLTLSARLGVLAEQQKKVFDGATDMLASLEQLNTDVQNLTIEGLEPAVKTTRDWDEALAELKEGTDATTESVAALNEELGKTPKAQAAPTAGLLPGTAGRTGDGLAPVDPLAPTGFTLPRFNIDTPISSTDLLNQAAARGNAPATLSTFVRDPMLDNPAYNPDSQRGSTPDNPLFIESVKIADSMDLAEAVV